MIRAVDAHQHFWDPAQVPVPWLGPEHGTIARAFTPEDLEPLREEAYVGQTVLVQSACLDADTDAMLAHARRYAWIGAVVVWLPLESREATATLLAHLAAEPKVRGVRHLIHDEPDPHWILQQNVLESLELVEQRGLVLELSAVFPRHLADVPELARSFPALTIVIDHLGKPPIGTDRMGEWSRQLAAAAAEPNVAAKISGLNTATENRDWNSTDIRPSICAALDAFGVSRLLCGSDWPMALLNGDYLRIWRETRRALEELSVPDQEALLTGTVNRLYGLEGDGAH
jgi:L-fucono-1,5-lactonase